MDFIFLRIFDPTFCRLIFIIYVLANVGTKGSGISVPISQKDIPNIIHIGIHWSSSYKSKMQNVKWKMRSTIRKY